MTPMRIAGVLLIVAGLARMICGGFSWTHEKTVVDIGPFQATAKEKQDNPNPPVVGGILSLPGRAPGLARSKADVVPDADA